jgi:hypothetical protein
MLPYVDWRRSAAASASNWTIAHQTAVRTRAATCPAQTDEPLGGQGDVAQRPEVLRPDRRQPQGDPQQHREVRAHLEHVGGSSAQQPRREVPAEDREHADGQELAVERDAEAQHGHRGHEHERPLARDQRRAGGGLEPLEGGERVQVQRAQAGPEQAHRRGQADAAQGQLTGRDEQDPEAGDHQASGER